MSRTLTAMFDSRSEAERAREELQRIGATAEIIDQDRLGGSGSYSDTYGNTGASGSGMSRDGSSGSGRGFWAELKDMFVSDEDRYSYEEGVRRGGVLLTARVDESRADEAYQILDRGGSVDLDQREQSWRSEGWQGYQGRQQQALGTTSSSASATSASEGVVQEERIPIVEEQLRVGKREVTRGGARVRSYIEEVPVDETVNLREEHVHIERRPVDQPLTGQALAGDAFQERTVEVTETAEEPVVAKEARVKEELVVAKTTTERTEQIHDKVRRTQVEVDEGLTGTDRDTSGERGAFGFDKDR